MKFEKHIEKLLFLMVIMIIASLFFSIKSCGQTEITKIRINTDTLAGRGDTTLYVEDTLLFPDGSQMASAYVDSAYNSDTSKHARTADTSDFSDTSTYASVSASAVTSTDISGMSGNITLADHTYILGASKVFQIGTSGSKTDEFEINSGAHITLNADLSPGIYCNTGVRFDNSELVIDGDYFDIQSAANWTIRDNRASPHGLIYEADYSANATALNIPSIGHVSAIIGDSLKQSTLILNSVSTDSTRIKGKLIVDEYCEADSFLATVSSTWYSDYVFKKGYKVMSLNDKLLFCRVNGHLPYMPRPENNKIELTTYIAALERNLEELTIQVADLQKKVGRLKREKRLKKKIKRKIFKIRKK